jgi:hypothetical protein
MAQVDIMIVMPRAPRHQVFGWRSSHKDQAIAAATDSRNIKSGLAHATRPTKLTAAAETTATQERFDIRTRSLLGAIA